MIIIRVIIFNFIVIEFDIILTRLCWGLLQKPQEFWAKVLIAKYGEFGDQRGTSSKVTSSHTRKSIFQGYETMRHGWIFWSCTSTKGWISLNLSHDLDKFGCYCNCSYIFRESVHIIWGVRNLNLYQF